MSWLDTHPTLLKMPIRLVWSGSGSFSWTPRKLHYGTAIFLEWIRQRVSTIYCTDTSFIIWRQDHPRYIIKLYFVGNLMSSTVPRCGTKSTSTKARTFLLQRNLVNCFCWKAALASLGVLRPINLCAVDMNTCIYRQYARIMGWADGRDLRCSFNNNFWQHKGIIDGAIASDNKWNSAQRLTIAISHDTGGNHR